MQLEVELGKDEPGERVTCEDDLLPVVGVGDGDEDSSGLLLEVLGVAVGLDPGDEDNDLLVGLDMGHISYGGRV